MNKLIKLSILFVFALLFTNNLYSQNDTNSRYGGVFAPVDSIRVLFLFIGYGEKDSMVVDDWKIWAVDSAFPNVVRDSLGNNNLFYEDFSMFDTDIDPVRDVQNISRWFYEQSKLTGRPLKLIGSAVRVNVDKTPLLDIWPHYGDEILDSLSEFHRDSTHPFRWEHFDNRRNRPSYSADYSAFNHPDSITDGIIDYVAVIYRDMPDILATAAASAISGSRDGYTIDASCGYRQFKYKGNYFWGFVHEVFHQLGDFGHYGGMNGAVVSNNFHTNAGMWGAMNLAQWHNFNVANAWERWFIGWMSEIRANNVPSFKSYPLQTDYSVFILRDFADSNDAVCIEIPSDTLGNKQRIWLENHQMNCTYDKKIGYLLDKFWQPFPVNQFNYKGLYVYVEGINGRLDTIIGSGRMEANNKFKPLHAQGNYDYRFDSIFVSPELWGTTSWAVTETAVNPYSGQSRWDYIRLDTSRGVKNSISLVTGTQNGTGNDHSWIVKRGNDTTYDFFGRNANFTVGKKIGMATNPPLVNYPTYSSSGVNMGLAPLILNGIEIEVLSDSGGEIKVAVRRNKVDIDSNFRMAARRIELMNITGNMSSTCDGDPDLRVMPNCTLTINRTGSVTRHTKRGDRFNDPTTFTCHTGSIFRVQPDGRVELRDSTTLALRAGSKLIVDSLGVVWVSCCSKIVSADNNNIELLGNFNNRGKIIFANCGGFVDTTFYTASICKKADDDFYLSLKVSKFHFDSHFPSHFFIEFDSTYSLRNLIDISSLYAYSGMDSVDVSVLLTNYFYSLHGADFDIDTIGKVYFYFLHFDGSLHRWTININPSVAFKLEERLNKEGIKNFVSGKTVSLYFPNDEQRTISLPIDIEGCETEYQDSVFLSKGFCERELPPIHFNCDDCEGGDLVFKIYGYSLPDITVNRNCSGGALLEAFGGINCGGLSFRWVRVDDDGNSEKMETGKNLDNVVVSKTGKYRIEYFHPDDPSKVIYYSRSEEVEQEHLGEQILTDRGTMVYPSYHLTSDNSMYLCAFVPFFNVHKDYIDYKFTLYMRGEKNSFWGSPEPLVVHSAVHDKETPHYIYLFRLLECELREYKIVIRDPNTDRVVCELIIPVDCECYTCDGLAKQFTVKKGEFYKVIHNLQFQYTAGSCVYKIKIPAGVDVDSIKRNGASLSLASYLDTVDGNIYFNYTTNRPCDIIPDSLIRDTFEIFYYDFEGNPCSIKRVFECRCEGIRNRYMLTVHPKVYPLEYILTYCKGSLSPPIPPEDEDLDFWLYDNFGNRIQLLRTLQAGSIPCGDFDFNMPNNYPNGIYHITLENNKGQMLGNEKFVFVK